MGTRTIDDINLTALSDADGQLVPDTDMSHLAISVGKPLTDPQAHHLAALTGYAWRARMNGTALDYTHPLAAPDLILIAKTAWDVGRSDPVHAWAGFVDLLGDYVRDGTPLRLTNRAGAGTQGTRLLAGLGADEAAALVVYCDKVLDVTSAAFLQAMQGVPTRALSQPLG